MEMTTLEQLKKIVNRVIAGAKFNNCDIEKIEDYKDIEIKAIYELETTVDSNCGAYYDNLEDVYKELVKCIKTQTDEDYLNSEFITDGNFEKINNIWLNLHLYIPNTNKEDNIIILEFRRESDTKFTEIEINYEEEIISLDL